MKGFFKISGIYFDTKPTEGSNNVVTSDGVAKAIKEGSYDDTELRNRITQAESDIDSLETTVSEKASVTSVTALTERVTQAESDIDTLETSVSEKASVTSVTALTERITQAESDIDSLETTVSEKASVTSVTALTERVTQAESDIDTLETSVSEKASVTSVTALTERVTQAESDIDTLETSVSELNEIIKPVGTQTTLHRNYTNIKPSTLFDSAGVMKTPTELIIALKAKGYLIETSGFNQLHSCINFVNTTADRIVISDGTHNINLINGWIEFEGAYLSGSSSYGSEETWVMKLYDVANCNMALITKRAGSDPIMKTITLH